ncbi:MAG TPA: BON domain-containing protein [Vicinamibacteria bacterium]|nr:BON domain-containing protein [Vicinamibacteria bacterium]
MRTLALLILLLSPAQPSDDRLQQNVRKVLEEAGFDSSRVRVTTHGGAVTLSGEVSDAREKLRAIQAVFGVAEVESVDTELRLLFGKTPEVEEEIWSLLMQYGLDRGITTVLVEDRIATLRGEVANDETREKIVSVTKNVSGVASVVDEIVTASADADAGSSEAPTEDPTSDTATVAELNPAAADEEIPPVPVETREEPSLLPEPPERPLDAPDEVDSTLVAREIIHRIITYPGYTVFDNIQFGFDGGIVTLSGVVTEIEKKDELEQRIASLAGVVAIDNKMRVLPNSSADQKLRETLFRQIYENPLFSEYAGQRNPPIHILVEAQGVVLTGVVDEVLQRMVAEGLVLNTFGVRSVQNRIRVREQRNR